MKFWTPSLLFCWACCFTATFPGPQDEGSDRSNWLSVSPGYPAQDCRLTAERASPRPAVIHIPFPICVRTGLFEPQIATLLLTCSKRQDIWLPSTLRVKARFLYSAPKACMFSFPSPPHTFLSLLLSSSFFSLFFHQHSEDAPAWAVSSR